jgi:Holliday junction DNA helicase RuvB
MLSAPFRSRFGASFRLNFYEQRDLEKIIIRSANLLKVEIEPEAVKTIASASRFTPRVANRLLKRVRDFSQMNDASLITKEMAEKALKMLEIDEKGLEETDRKILLTIINNFDNGPVGLKSIAASISEEESTIEDVYEPYLIQIGFLARTPKGRVVTSKGFEHLGLKKPSLF